MELVKTLGLFVVAFSFAAIITLATLCLYDIRTLLRELIKVLERED